MAPGRTSPVWVLSCLLAGLVSACGSRAGSAESAHAATVDVSPARQIDWLPADAAAVAYIDVAALRETDLYRALAPHIPEHPPVRSIVDRTDSFRIAVVARGAHPALVGLFQGDYDDHAHPAALSEEPLERATFDGREVFVRPKSGDRWFRTPEGFWVVTEQELWSKVAPAPEQRAARLSASAWARPLATPNFLHVAITMSPLWREQIAASVSDPLVAAMFMPAIEELDVVSFDVLPDAGGGLALRLGADFTGTRGAQAAAFILEAGVVAARASAQGMTFPDEAADAGASMPPEPQSVDPQFSAGEQMGRVFGQMLEDLDIEVDGNHLRATLVVPGEDLARARDQVAEALQKSEAGD
jgi:hypothetical protein